MVGRFLCFRVGLAIAASALTLSGAPFSLPTANQALFEPGGEERYFVGTPGKPWITGAFGCVRSDGWQMHEGLDIRCLDRDKRGEPTDAILATAEGRVAYINRKASLSNYGIYIILRHEVQGLEIYSLYSHLSRVTDGLSDGQPVQAGQVIGIMGRTANTATRISKERAHLHFELNLLVNERFAAWHQKRLPGERNDHGLWNGRNLLGLDPRQILLTQRLHGERFDLVHVIRSQPELMRVMVRETDFPWLRRYPELVRPNPVAQQQGVAGYEIVFNFNGVPFELIPRAESEMPSKARVKLLSVNAAEYELRPGRRLVSGSAGSWRLGRAGEDLIDLLLFR
jgi:murein DD-endopeptidase MepM/ murein hydrolase activator NlpD